MTQVEHIGEATLYCGDCLEILPTLGEVDAVVTDPPYSERVHKGHRDGLQFGDGANRGDIGYEAITSKVIAILSVEFARLASSWVVWMCDSEIAAQIEHKLETEGLTGFAPLPFVAPGSRVRLSGDGPSCWTIWIVVARTKRAHRWGTLPGAYILPKGRHEHTHMGGKPTWLMEQLTTHYTRPQGTILDPFMGSGTTGVACANLGRKFIGIEIEQKYFDIACERITAAYAQCRLFA